MNLAKANQVHCIGIGGIGLSAIAEILLERGKVVTGSDMNESQVTDRLIKKGAYVFLGHREKNVEGADLIIYSAAIGRDNPELLRAREKGLTCLTRAEALGELMGEYETSIAISGTHGKTTTTSMVSLILRNANLKPTILVGGNLSELEGNVEVGHGDFFVTEACEYMDSFLELRPKVEIILNIDSDHLDYFKDIDHIASSFDKFARLVPSDGLIIAYDANPFVHSVTQNLTNVVSFGLSDKSTYYAQDINFDIKGMPSFTVFCKGEKLCEIKLSIPGEHNILNSLAAFACCHKLGVEPCIIADTLEGYKGTERRFDIIGTTERGVRLVDDYAHHPTEIRATLRAAQKVPHEKLWCLFQPHTYTRTMALFNEFAGAFEEADRLILAEIYAAREKNIHKLSSAKLIDEIKREYPEKHALFIKDFDEMASYVYENAKPGDLVITMGAGDIYKVAELILEKDFEK